MPAPQKAIRIRTLIHLDSLHFSFVSSDVMLEVAIRSEAIAARVEAVASRLEAIAY